MEDTQNEQTTEADPASDDRRRVLVRLAESLLKKRDRAVEYRNASGVETRWIEDELAFDGVDGLSSRARMIDFATGDAYIKRSGEPKRSQVVVNIIRGKCETAEARFADILLPTDDRNWGLDVTPVPEMVEAAEDDRPASVGGAVLTDEAGQQMSMSDVAEKAGEKGTKRMKAMETEIDDQLTECDYNAAVRKVIRSSSRAGTGILKGPNVVKNLKKTWAKEGDMHVLSTSESMTPASKWVNYWNVYPNQSCGEDIKRAAYIWERDIMLPREARELLGIDGYFDDQILKVLMEEPKRLTMKYDDKKGSTQLAHSSGARGDHYEYWEYYGEMLREDLETLEVEIDHDTVSQSLSVCVVFLNDRPIKVMLNTLDTGEMPYDFFPWTTVTDSPWGIGVARMLVWLQRIITAAWRAMMDNAGDSSGANVVIGRGIEPQDGNWEITGKKIWRLMSDDVGDVRNAFQQFQVANNQKDLEAIIELALRFVDMETSLPMLFSGEKGEAPETLGATNIMVDSNNVALRGRAKLFDDLITTPHITRYYNWNMQYNDDEELKGDYNVDARGASVLVQKDQQAQTLMSIMQAKNDPDIALRVDWDKATQQLFSALKLDILKDDATYKKDKAKMQEQPPETNPQLAIAKMRAEGDMQKAQMVQQSDMAEIERKGQNTAQELQFKAQMAREDQQHDLQMKQMDYEIKMMEYSEKRDISLSELKAKLSSDALKLQTQIRLSDKGSAPQVATPAVEPGGRAPDGKAFEA